MENSKGSIYSINISKEKGVPKQGIFAKIVKGGTIAVNDSIYVVYVVKELKNDT